MDGDGDEGLITSGMQREERELGTAAQATLLQSGYDLVNPEEEGIPRKRLLVKLRGRVELGLFS